MLHAKTWKLVREILFFTCSCFKLHVTSPHLHHLSSTSTWKQLYIKHCYLNYYYPLSPYSRQVQTSTSFFAATRTKWKIIHNICPHSIPHLTFHLPSQPPLPTTKKIINLLHSLSPTFAPQFSSHIRYLTWLVPSSPFPPNRTVENIISESCKTISFVSV